MDKLNVYCIPGLGVNAFLFKKLRLPDCNIFHISWQSPIKNETLPRYAMRLSQQIDTSKPFVLIGVSFGGMCAIEIAKVLQPLKIILVSSCKVHTELPIALKALKYIPLHLLLSDALYLKFTGLVKHRLGVTKELNEEFKEMLKWLPVNYFSRTINMILHWKNETIPSGVVHIHGNADHVLFYNKKVHYDYTIEGGSHFMIVDRAGEINEIINKEQLKFMENNLG